MGTSFPNPQILQGHEASSAQDGAKGGAGRLGVGRGGQLGPTE